jgi:predicted DNA-binding ribbon-helix-helix protein
MEATAMESNASRKRSVIVHKRRTSVSLEDSFWESLHAIVRVENITIGDFIERISRQRPTSNLSSSLRVAVLEYYKHLATTGIADPVRQGDPGPSLEPIVSFWNDPDRRKPSDQAEVAPGALSAIHQTHR